MNAELVGSSDFRAEAGSQARLALETYSDTWAPASDEDRRQPVVVVPGSGVGPTELLLTGVVLPYTRSVMLGGWVLDVDGIPIWVATSHPDPPPPDGSWVRVRGTMSISDGYVVDQVQEALRRPTERLWLVRDIVRLRPVTSGGSPTFAPEAVTSIRHTGDASSYLIDLHGPLSACCPDC